jgi:5-methylcytosine-specific restriction endonuclease McrA
VSRGSKHYNWKGGITDQATKDRNSQALKDWRTFVFNRDKFLCQICGSKGKRLNAHHLESFHSNQNLRFDVNNGVTLCYKCHTQFHKKYGKINNTTNQFIEYKNERVHA